MKKIRIFCLVLALTAWIAGLLPAVFAEGVDQSVTSGCHSVDAALMLSEAGRLTETAKAVILYERNSDTVLYHYNPDQRIYPSSMVKLMTALIALEQGDLEDPVVVTKRALSHVAPGSVSAGLSAGEELTLESLLYCMMTASANDAATVIAEHIAGSQEAFVELMNQRAAELGCTGTHFTNAHGLHDENNYTTARDICRITDFALDNEMFKTLFCAKTYTVPATNKKEARVVNTSNHMMSTAETPRYLDQRVTGGKTGSTDQAGRCLVATAENGGMELLTIVMGAKPVYAEDGSIERYGSFEETKELLDYAFSSFDYRQIFYEGQILGQAPVSGGENNVILQPVRSQATVLPKELDETLVKWVTTANSTGMLTAPVAQGQVISTLQVWYGSKCVAQTDLTAMNAVAVWTEPTQPIRQGAQKKSLNFGVIGIVLAVILGLAILAAAVMVFLRFARKARLNANRRSRRKNRRRNQ